MVADDLRRQADQFVEIKELAAIIGRANTDQAHVADVNDDVYDDDELDEVD
jgi:hypothetical protein